MKIYTSSSHSFFDDLVTILSSLTFFAREIENQSNTAIDPSYSIGMGGCAIKTDLEFFPYELMKVLSSDDWPTQIELQEKPYQSCIPEKIANTLSSGGIQRLTSNATQGAFIRYFENQRSSVESRYGSDPYQWAEWNFGRVIRNAFAHGGKIKFDNPNARSVSWKTLSYSPSDNDRQIIYQDISQVDIIYLMEEMDAMI